MVEDTLYGYYFPDTITSAYKFHIISYYILFFDDFVVDVLDFGDLGAPVFYFFFGFVSWVLSFPDEADLIRLLSSSFVFVSTDCGLPPFSSGSE